MEEKVAGVKDVNAFWNIIKEQLRRKECIFPDMSITVNEIVWNPISCSIAFGPQIENKIHVFLLLTFVGHYFDIKCKSYVNVKYKNRIMSYKGGAPGITYKDDDQNISLSKLSNEMYSEEMINDLVDFYRKDFEKYTKSTYP